MFLFTGFPKHRLGNLQWKNPKRRIHESVSMKISEIDYVVLTTNNLEACLHFCTCQLPDIF